MSDTDTAPDTSTDASAMGSIADAFDKVFPDDDGSEDILSAPEPEDAPEPDDTETAPSDAVGTGEGTPDPSGSDETPVPTDEGDKKAPKKDEPEPDPEPIAADDADSDKFATPPQRLSEEAKSAWAQVPVGVRAEVTRAMGEMETGIEKYRDDAEKYDEFREVGEAIEANGQKVGDVISHYRGIEEMLAADPLRGLDTICRNLGSDLRTVAAQVLGQTVDQTAQQQNTVVNELQQQIQALQGQITGITTQSAQDIEARTMADIDAFAAGNEHFEAVSDDMTLLIDTGKADTIQNAYDMAVRINNLSSAASNAAPVASDAKADAEPKRDGNLSIDGAPVNGTAPAGAKPKRSKDLPHALSKAFDEAGIR